MSEIDPETRIVENVRAFASPHPGGHGRAPEMLAALELSHRRRRRTGASVLAAAAVVVAGTVGVSQWLPERTTPGDGPTTAIGPAPVGGDWRPMSVSPLSPRHSSLGVWTGDELVVVGGRTGFVCPPNADCVGNGDPNAEAAAYDPRTDVWRTLPDLPVAVQAAEAEDQVGDRIAWDGDEVVVVRGDTTYTLDLGEGSTRAWDERPVRDLSDQLVPDEQTERLLVHAAYSTPASGSAGADWVLDPATGERTFFPADPFAESYDRSIAFDGERFWLMSMDVEQHYAAYEGAPSRLAVLEDGQWRVVDDATPAMVYRQRMFWDGTRLVVPPTVAEGRWYNPVTKSWGTLAPVGHFTSTDAGYCDLPEAGLGREWIAGVGGVLVRGDITSGVPRCDDLLEAPAVAVWADDELLVWGGAGPDGDKAYRVSAAGLRWRPPTP